MRTQNENFNENEFLNNDSYEDYNISELKNIDTITKYLKEISQYKLLTKEEEMELFKRYKEQNDKEAKQILFKSNLRLVVYVAKKYIPYSSSLDMMDLIMEGNIGLNIAIEKFEYEKDYKFSTYAFHWIKQGMTRALSNYDSMIRIPVHINDKVRKYNNLNKEYKSEHNGEEIPDKEAMKVLKFTKNDIQDCKYIIDTLSVVSYNVPVRNTDETEDSELGDFIEDKTINGDSFLKNCTEDEILKIVDEVIHNMSNGNEKKFAKIKDIIYRRFGLKGDSIETLATIGDDYNLSRERVRQIENSFIKTCRSSKYKKLFENFKK